MVEMSVTARRERVERVMRILVDDGKDSEAGLSYAEMVVVVVVV